MSEMIPASRTFWNSLTRNWMVILGLVMLLSTVLVAVFADWIAPYDPKAAIKVEISDVYRSPDAQHWLGT
ncbi:MAG: hypothetical protein HPY76_01995, partial [Anaerolineae bacterium]|nr:hypothetical protein [Anaerolineae bacterium]